MNDELAKLAELCLKYNLLDVLGFDRIYFMGKASMFRTIHITSGIWQNPGWNSILYITAISNIDQQLYESAKDYLIKI